MVSKGGLNIYYIYNVILPDIAGRERYSTIVREMPARKMLRAPGGSKHFEV